MNLSRALLAIMFGLTGVASAQGEALPLHLELIDGREVEVRCLTPTFRLETDYGTVNLNLNKVREIDFQPSGDRIRVVVVLADKSHIVGTALTKELILE